jgi:hypothetical protein
MKLRCSHGVHGLQPLLEKLPSAKRVMVLTYSLDTNPKSSLLEGLHKLPEDCLLTVITNVPGRWSSYSEKQAVKMAERFDSLLENLTPDNFACASEIYFSFSNHAKVLIVDDIAYVGSANFTEASARNFEAGVIITGKEELAELSEFVKVIRMSSLPLLKAGNVKEGRTILKLALWSPEIVRSVREENGFSLSDDGGWIEDEDREYRESIRISEKLLRFLGECRTAAEQLLQLCGGPEQVLNDGVLKEVIDFVCYFEEREHGDSLPKPFDEGRVSNQLIEELLNICSNDGNVNDVLNHPEYQDKLVAARSASEEELDLAVGEAIEELVEHIETTTSKLRSSFGQDDVSPQIDNTRGKYGR